jgi:hypothetical protein
MHSWSPVKTLLGIVAVLAIALVGCGGNVGVDPEQGQDSELLEGPPRAGLGPVPSSPAASTTGTGGSGGSAGSAGSGGTGGGGSHLGQNGLTLNGLSQ